ncbi:cytochrome c3 family protein [Microbulbifer sp. S227A]|uniref:cytochrome c3 family protein n=1 Tax=Microbulbifer sp. S227A TaxID=3415131 RepID=UPI003C7988A5
MKGILAILLLIGTALVVLGPPFAPVSANRVQLFEDGEPILPMTFAHNDHFGVACATCHHEFVDGTTGLPCIACHSTDRTVAHLFEHQFHTLCRSCHMREQAAGKASGPTRRCIDCHLPDSAF